MRILSYRVRFETEGDQIFAVIPSVPQVIASGSSEPEALQEAELGLDAVIRFMLKEGLDVPQPEVGEELAVASPLTAAKAFVIEAFRRSNLGASELGRRTGLDEKEIRRVLDPYHATRIGRMAEVAAALGQRITVAVAA